MELIPPSLRLKILTWSPFPLSSFSVWKIRSQFLGDFFNKSGWDAMTLTPKRNGIKLDKFNNFKSHTYTREEYFVQNTLPLKLCKTPGYVTHNLCVSFFSRDEKEILKSSYYCNWWKIQLKFNTQLFWIICMKRTKKKTRELR